MILDRQLPKGGWNYGSTVVFGKELYPLPDETGLALYALLGHVGFVQIEKSIAYLKNRIKQLSSPLSLGWAILGLNAWGFQPSEYQEMILESFKRQERFGNYSTVGYCILVLASQGKINT